MSGRCFVKRDIHRYYYPVWHYAHEELARGAFPLWNPFTDFGVPFFANVQTCVAYPGSLIYFFFDFATAFNWLIVLHLAAAGFFTYLWLRDCSRSRTASFIGGVAYAANGYLLSTINLTISLQSCAWFPLVLLAYRRSLWRRGWRPKAAAALALTLQYLAGDPAVCFATFIVLGLYAVWRTGEKTIAAKRPDPSPLLHLAQVTALFAAFSAFQLFPFVELLTRSTRTAMGYAESTMWSMPLHDVAGIAVPFFADLNMGFLGYWSRQSWLENAYTGVSVLALALLALLRPVSRSAALHAGLALLGLGLALGKNAPVYALFREIVPFFSIVRYPVRFFFLFSFGAACLAAFGADRLLSSPKIPVRGPRGKAVLLLGLCAAAVGLSVSAVPLSDAAAYALRAAGIRVPFSEESLASFLQSSFVNLGRSFVFAALTAAAAFAAAFARPRRWVLGAFLAAVVTADLVPVNAFEPTVAREDFFRISENVALLKKDAGVYRVLASPTTVNRQWFPTGDDFAEIHRELSQMLTPNLLLLHRVANTIGYDSIFLSNVAAVERAVMRIRRPSPGASAAERRPDPFLFLDWLNVKYVISAKTRLGEPFEPLTGGEYGTLFLNGRVMPRAFLVREAVRADDGRALLDRLSRNHRPLEKVYVSEDPEPGPAALPGESSVKIVSYEPGRVVMEAVVSDRPWLFFSDSFYPGWRARIDGRPVKIYRANHAFRAVRVPPGTHRIVWSYEPPVFYAGAAVSLAAALVSLAAFLRRPASKPLFSRRLRIAL